jgi:putative endonuclease
VDAGAAAERLVEENLRTDGWALLDANWRGGGGELDRVMTRDGHLRFVEVKLRADDDALADDAVPHHKRARLRGAARAWMEARPDVPFVSCAFTVAWVDGTGAVRLVDDAFDG